MFSFSRSILLIVSFFLVAFGQPAAIPFNGVLAACLGYALFWKIVLEIPSKKNRFTLSMLWFCAVQLVQLSWFISHPYAYIYAVYFLLSFGLGVQFGWISVLITYKNIDCLMNLLGIASLWTILEWSRLFYFSGFSWNPVGLSLSSTLYGMQMASMAGVFGLSFWVIFTNLLGLRFWVQWTKNHPCLLDACPLWIAAALFPYLYGAWQISSHQDQLRQAAQAPFSALLVQPAFPVEETSFASFEELRHFVTEEWVQVLQLLKKRQQLPLDLIVLPEYLVPLGTWQFAYPVETVFKHFSEQFGAESVSLLPPLDLPYCILQKDSSGAHWLANNAFWAQGIANLFEADLLIGLEDVDENSEHQLEYYSGALLFHPFDTLGMPERYEKRVLVPMGEYIPFAFCAKLAAGYGIFSSFTPGQEAKVFNCRRILLSPSICYEETFGALIAQGKQKGADLLVNLTSDVWYPNSTLPRQHLDHARLRTVENGVPLIRACNTGVTAAFDSLGRVLAILGGDAPEKVEWVPDTLHVNIPLYSYSTLYSITRDWLIISLSFCLAGVGVVLFGLITHLTQKEQMEERIF